MTSPDSMSWEPEPHTLEWVYGAVSGKDDEEKKRSDAGSSGAIAPDVANAPAFSECDPDGLDGALPAITGGS